MNYVLLIKRCLKKLFYMAFAKWRIFSNFPATLAGKIRNNLATVVTAQVTIGEHH
jgi:hypothetical protein